MAESKAELVRRAYKAFNSSDFETAIREFLHPEVEWHGTRGGLTEGERAQGADQVNEQVGPSREAWDEWTIEPEEIIDVGGDVVLVLNRERMRGHSSGIELESLTAALITVRDGQIVRFQGFLDQDEARRAAGLAHE